ncbi:MAG: hypothetical protein IPN86_00850 [Saprospiraceae bacterium]|nr:hypothetical protein [Saprospiraceae bacterium]
MAAASIVLLLVAVWLIEKREKVYNVHYAIFEDKQFENELILHSTKRAIKQDIILSADQRKAYELYGLMLFEEASPLLLKLWNTKSDTLALFSHGVCEMGLGHEKTGRQIFIKSELTRYQDKIRKFDKIVK